MKKLYFTLALILFGFTLFSQKLPFQGYLEESGAPVNGTRTFDFELQDYGWSETIADVPIDNGIYNVVLGEVTPLPDSLFVGTSESPLNITIDGTSIGQVMLYKPLINGNSLLSNGQSLQVRNPAGKLRADLNYFSNNDAGSLVLNGANDSTKVILGSIAGGYGGFLGLYDSLRNIGAQIRVSNKGRGNLFTSNEAHYTTGWFGGIDNDGFTQLVSYDETDAISGAILLGSFADGIHPEVYIEGIAQPNFGLGRFRVIELPGGEETAQLEINRSNGGGQAKLQIIQDDAGADPTGVAGTLELFADSSPNFILGTASWEDHDLANMDMYGSIADGTGWYYNAANFGVRKTSNGLNEFGQLSFYNNQAGSQTEGVFIAGNLFESGAGGIEIRDSTGFRAISLYGSNRNIEVSNSTNDGRVTVSSIQDTGGSDPTGFTGEVFAWGNGTPNVRIGGKNWEDHGRGNVTVFGKNDNGAGWYHEVVNLGAETDGTNEWGLISLRKDNTDMISLDANTGSGNFQNASIGSETNGIVHIYGEDNTGIDNLRLQLDVRSDGLGSSFAFIEMRDAAFNTSISLDASNGLITATTVNQTSDRRLKTNIQSLSGALDNTLKMRGASYYWKDENKSDERQIGVIAQEVEEIYPEFVHTDKDGVKSVNYAQITAVLIEAVKELNAKVEKLETENTDLTAALEETKKLSDRIGKIEKLLLDGNKVSSN